MTRMRIRSIKVFIEQIQCLVAYERNPQLMKWRIIVSKDRRQAFRSRTNLKVYFKGLSAFQSDRVTEGGLVARQAVLIDPVCLRQIVFEGLFLSYLQFRS